LGIAARRHRNRSVEHLAKSGILASGKHTKNYGKSPFLMGKSTISMVIINSYVKLPEGSGYEWNIHGLPGWW